MLGYFAYFGVFSPVFPSDFEYFCIFIFPPLLGYFGLFWVFLPFLCIFAYFWTYLTIFGYFPPFIGVFYPIFFGYLYLFFWYYLRYILVMIFCILENMHFLLFLPFSAATDLVGLLRQKGVHSSTGPRTVRSKKLSDAGSRRTSQMFGPESCLTFTFYLLDV